MRHAQTCYKRGRTTCAAQDIRGFFVGGEDAKLELKIRVAACTQARIQALLRMEDAVLRDSLIAQGRAVEGELTLDDLTNGFFIGNALRGLMRARLI